MPSKFTSRYKEIPDLYRLPQIAHKLFRLLKQSRRYEVQEVYLRLFLSSMQPWFVKIARSYKKNKGFGIASLLDIEQELKCSMIYHLRKRNLSNPLKLAFKTMMMTINVLERSSKRSLDQDLLLSLLPLYKPSA